MLSQAILRARGAAVFTCALALTALERQVAHLPELDPSYRPVRDFLVQTLVREHAGFTNPAERQRVYRIISKFLPLLPRFNGHSGQMENEDMREVLHPWVRAEALVTMLNTSENISEMTGLTDIAQEMVRNPSWFPLSDEMQANLRTAIANAEIRLRE